MLRRRGGGFSASFSLLRLARRTASAKGAGCDIDGDPLSRAHMRSDDGAAIAAQIVIFAGAAKQRPNKLGRVMLAGCRPGHPKQNSRHREIAAPLVNRSRRL